MTYNEVKNNYQQIQFSLKYKFDLALCIYSPNTFLKASEFLKENGILIYLPLPSDYERSQFPQPYQFKGIIHRKKENYFFRQTTDTHVLTKKPDFKYLKGNRFVDQNYYSVYYKM